MGNTLKDLKLECGDKVVHLDSYVVFTYIGGRSLENSFGKVFACGGWASVARYARLEGPKFKVGDKVVINAYPDLVQEVVYVQNVDGRIFYVVVFKGDIPKSYRECDLSLAPPQIKRESFVVNLSGEVPLTTKGLKTTPSGGFLISYNRVDGVVDVSSVKMEGHL